MKKLSILFCTGLFAAAIAGGCKKDEKKDGAGGGGGGDCAALGAKFKKDAAAEMPKDAPAEQKKMMTDMVEKLVPVLVKACTDDKWSKEAIACGLKAKDMEKECDDKLSKEQKDNMEKAFQKAMGMGGDEPAGGGEGTAAATGAADGTAAATGEAPAAGGAASTGMAECDEYVAAMEKYLACDKIPQETRDAAKQGVDAMKGSWANASALPDDAKKQMADACKTAVDALKQGATALGCTL